jgi:hypothetical protein
MNSRTITLLAAIIALCASCVAALQLGADRQLVLGLAAGGVLGFGLTLLGGVSIGRAIRRGGKGAALTHIYGGIVLRLALLVIGFMVLAATGWASPVGYALAFFGGVVAAMLRQVVVFVREARPAAANG